MGEPINSKAGFEAVHVHIGTRLLFRGIEKCVAHLQTDRECFKHCYLKG